MSEQPGPAAPAGTPGRADMGGLARRGVLSLGGAAVSAVANLGLIVLVTRGFSRETAGHLFSATSLFVLLEALCALGAATGSVYFVARVRALGRRDQVPALLRLALRPVVVVSLAVAALLLVLAEPVGGLLGDGDQPVAFVRLLAVFLPFAVVFDVLIACTQGFHTMTPTVLLEKVGRPLLQVVLVATGAALGAAAALPVLWTAPYAVGAALVAVALARLLRADAAGGARPGAPPPPTDGAAAAAAVDARTFWRFTAPRGVAAAAQQGLQRVDIILVAAMLGAVEAAVYTAATRFLVLGQLGSQAVALAVQPKFSELLARDDLTTTRQVYRTSTAWVMAVTWPVHLAVAVTAPVLMGLFGAGYAEGRSSVVVLALAMLVATGCGMVTMLLLMAGRSMLNLLNVVVALSVNIGLDLVLIPTMGIVGAAVSWAVSIVAANLLPLVQVRRGLGLDPFGRGSLDVALLCLVCFALVPALGWFVGPVAVLVLLVAVGLPAYGVGLYRLRTRLDLDELVSSIRRRAGRSRA